MGLKRAFESLISEWYRSSILTVGCIAVGISYCANNGYFKVFDSNIYCYIYLWQKLCLRDMCSIRYIIYRQLCALLSKFIWSNWSVWTKRFQITKYDVPISNSVREVLKRSSGQHQCYKDHCFAVVLYSICYSVISSCECLRCNHWKWISA